MFKAPVECLKKKEREQTEIGFGESTLALQNQQRFGEIENSFSRDGKGRGLLASCGPSTLGLALR